MQGVTKNYTAICGGTDLEIFNYAIKFLLCKGNARFKNLIQKALKKHPSELQPHRGNWDGEPTKVNRPATQDYTTL